MPTVTNYTALLSGDSWNGLEISGKPAVITYSFGTSASADDALYMGSALSSFQVLTDAQKQGIRDALAAWAAASGLQFVEVPDGAADISFRAYDFSGSPSDGAGGVGVYPFGDWNFYSYPNFLDSGFPGAGHVMLDTDFLAGGVFNHGLLLHEIGHALGLKHPTEDFNNYASGVDHNQVLASDDGATTVMTQQTGGPQALTDLDKAAIQAVYGTHAQAGSEYASWSYDSAHNRFTFNALATGGVTRGSSVGDTLNGSANNDTLYGLGGNDSLFANGGADVLFGGAGNDDLHAGNGSVTFYGGKGDDTYYVTDAAHDIVVEFGSEGTDTVSSSVSCILPAEVENLILTGAGDINGTGNGLDNALTGNAGSNSLDGGLGADTMTGGSGNDTYYVDNAGDTVREAAGGGTDTVYSTVSFYAGAQSIETIILTGTGNLNATGNQYGGNSLTGNAGNNILDGGLGGDAMAGGGGNDTYYVDNVGDKVVEKASGGTDTVYASVSFSAGTQSVETIILTGAGNINATGNQYGGNTLTGNAGDNALDGGLGGDTMTGGAGNDTYYVDNTGDKVREATGGGTDTVYASVSFAAGSQSIETIVLTGADNINATGNQYGGNSLTGNAGNNILDGAQGADTLTGGAGADTFLFNLASGADTVRDFSTAQGDMINIHAYTTGTANLAMLSTVGADVHIDLGGGNVITVKAVVNDAAFQSHIIW